MLSHIARYSFISVIALTLASPRDHLEQTTVGGSPQTAFGVRLNDRQHAIMSALVGKWKQVESDNYGALFDALGVPAETKELFLANKAEVEIGNDGDTWCIKSTVMGKTREDTFKLGEERDGVSIVGMQVKFTTTLEGDALVEVSKAQGKEVITRREVKGGQLVSTFTLGDVTASITSNKA
ncbi:fatty acid-binding protein, brain-like [Haliotis rubra]|uniref:fatty acid-binding protein, brain-like n=1 Tax=Haliotis rubra TaxID=36100 RepID=UPI001EE5DBB1|nr:fatty acid-binding protein, brain-like [Haliotis rubra]